MRRLTTGIRSEKCVIRLFRRCANVIEGTYKYDHDSNPVCRSCTNSLVKHFNRVLSRNDTAKILAATFECSNGDVITDLCRLTMGIRYGNASLGDFVIVRTCTHTNLDSTV